MSIKSTIKETKVMSKGRYSKSLESNPKDTESTVESTIEGTIMDNMNNIMALVKENRQLKRDRYGK